jgi:NAD(P)-dependent dehydrogenase (short-subunit alcohol dehydrogenase family)
MSNERNNLVEVIRQSKPIDTTLPYDTASLSGKTIVITGGASGFGAGFARLWASKGAYIIVGDVSDASGKALVEELRKESGSPHHHFIHCDVTNWQSQVDFFRSAAKLSPTGYINGVVANAGITDREPFQKLEDYDAIEEPKAPDFKCFNVNILGVMYTAKLALFWLGKSKNLQPSADRHLLLVGSVASLAPIPGLLEYSIAKHGVLGLFVRIPGIFNTSKGVLLTIPLLEIPPRYILRK